jgi:membrane-bound ClpP family serine protease
MYEISIIILVNIIRIFLLYILFSFIIKKYKIYNFIKLVEETNNSKLIFIRDFSDNWYVKLYYKLLSLFFDNVIELNDYEKIRKIFSSSYNKNIDVIIESIGGYILNNDYILDIMERFDNNINIYVINYAMSAATMIVLASSTIYMNPFASISPTDPQIPIDGQYYSYRSVMKLIEKKSINHIDDITIINYYDSESIYYKNYEKIKKYINKHLKQNVSQHKVKKILDNFAMGKLPHHTPFGPKELDILKIISPVPNQIMDIYKYIDSLYSLFE